VSCVISFVLESFCGHRLLLSKTAGDPITSSDAQNLREESHALQETEEGRSPMTFNRRLQPAIIDCASSSSSSCGNNLNKQLINAAEADIELFDGTGSEDHVRRQSILTCSQYLRRHQSKQEKCYPQPVSSARKQYASEQPFYLYTLCFLRAYFSTDYSRLVAHSSVVRDHYFKNSSFFLFFTLAALS